MSIYTYSILFKCQSFDNKSQIHRYKYPGQITDIVVLKPLHKSWHYCCCMMTENDVCIIQLTQGEGFSSDKVEF